MVVMGFCRFLHLQDRRARIPPGSGSIPTGEVEANFQLVVPGILHLRHVHSNDGTCSQVLVLMLMWRSFGDFSESDVADTVVGVYCLVGPGLTACSVALAS